MREVRESVPTRVPPQPVFVESGMDYRVRVFAGDFVNFALGVFYYLVCLTVGVVAIASDSVFGTRSYDRFIAVVERIDHGKEPSVTSS